MREAMELAPGRIFQGRWEIIRCITRGGMGAIYEVVHVETRARSALKVLLPELLHSAEMKARFRQEALVTASIQSDHIAKVFDGGADPETRSPFIVLELLVGRDLGAELEARGRLPMVEVQEIARQVGYALTKAHAAGVIHRDLKPENLFLTRRDDGSPCVKVLDFGISKLVAESTSGSATTRSLGTPVFMAPEQVRGEGTIGPAADLYTLAQVVYALLVGAPYWSEERKRAGAVYPVLMAICAGVKEPASERAKVAGVALTPAFDAWFARAAALDPKERYPSAKELVAGLERAAAAIIGLPLKTQAIELETQSTVRAPKKKEPKGKRTDPITIGPHPSPLPDELLARRRASAPLPTRPGPTAISAVDDLPAPTSTPPAIDEVSAPTTRDVEAALQRRATPRRAIAIGVGLIALVLALAIGLYGYFAGEAPKTKKPTTTPAASST